MNWKELDNFLREETVVEKEQKKRGENITELELVYFVARTWKEMQHQSTLRLPEEIFFKKGNVRISKHNRYAPMQEHTHDFLEINYMYSGKSTQEINGETVVLEQGEMVLFDKGTSHRFDALGEDDILINLLLKMDVVDTLVLKAMAQQKSIVSDFLIRMTHSDELETDYLIFRTKKNERVHALMTCILEHYFESDIPNMELIEKYIPILFFELTLSVEEMEFSKSDQINSVILTALKTIEDQYKTVTLTSLAQQLGFNKNYLSNLIKAETGKTFKEIVQQSRMQKAYQLVLHTNYTIEDIAYEIGLKDPSYFYRQFKKEYQISPSQMRKNKLSYL